MSVLNDSERDLRIESNGMSNGTLVTVGGEPVTNVTKVTWSVDASESPSCNAVLECDLFGMAIDATDWRWKPVTLRQRLRVAWWALTWKPR